ncbi:spermidine synthase [Arsukibacterium indicum]|uniref:Fused MFS/spermidine synthase n=1 Tax=Arsukibacterium indicum TaxID=2848612 RepID=A0ABS6MML5_9GAMM|nr:fused MFS/spermidine synthase [Arsukibacterium indicum]MBV2129619.1 fused MFS/spermidine synthase [Arsukibacterium indicum]
MQLLIVEPALALFALTILLSAALLFLVQPMLAKQLLPYFGGGAAVWAACMLFFQSLLLAGYGYAHLLGRYLAPKTQRLLHSTLLVLAISSLPLMWHAGIASAPDDTPLAAILVQLALLAGLPYLLLSATGPLLQHWFASRFPLRSPYRLYALSNLGSLGGLLAYPFILEPVFSLSEQRQYWVLGFVLFALCCLLLMWRELGQLSPAVRAVSARLDKKFTVHWLALSACGVVLLLAVTQQLTQNVPPVPFLWVLPLSLYLLSYIVVFNKPGWYQRGLWLYVFCLSMVFGLLLFYLGRQFDLISQLLLYLTILFSGCMLCHGELARLKPEPQYLTGFYLLLAAGGVLGSATVNLLAPLVFSQYWEFLLVLLAIYLLMLWPDTAVKPRWQRGLWLTGGLLFGLSITGLEWQLGQHNVYSERNFYGSLVVRDLTIIDEAGNSQLQRQLIDGTTSHGAQYLAPSLAGTAQSYYRPGTGAALALQHFLPAAPTRNINQLQQRNFGLVGLGAGALAVYGRPGDSMTFYELNPAVINVATKYFSYLADSAATVDIVPGDARLTLAAELVQQGSQQFDVLVLDAFSSDSIPQHLLTIEAMQLYWQHLQSDSVLAVHVSNNYLDLTSLLRNQAAKLGLDAYFIATDAQGINPAAQWVLITANQRFISQPVIQQALSPWPSALNPDVSWTDQRSNLLQVLK